MNRRRSLGWAREGKAGSSVFTGQGTSGTVTFDGATVVITRSGLVQVSVSGGMRGEARYPVGQLSGVRIQKPGAHAGQFTLIAAGTTAVSVGAASSGHDPMTVLFQRKSHQAFLDLVDAIETALAERSYGGGPAGARTQGAEPPSLAGELAHLARLHAEGTLSDSEFATAKARPGLQGRGNPAH